MSRAKRYVMALLGAGYDYRLGLAMLSTTVAELGRAKMVRAAAVMGEPTAAMRSSLKEQGDESDGVG